MNNGRKTKLEAERLEKREAPFMAIANQEETEDSSGGTTQERNTVTRDPEAEDPPIAQDEGGSNRRVRFERGQR